jgi:glucokinase
MTRRANKLILVVAIESVGALQQTVQYASQTEEPQALDEHEWDCSRYFSDPTGLRLFEEVIRRVRTYMADSGRQPNAVVVTLPGSVKDAACIERSTRLSILHPIDVQRMFEERGMPRCVVLHDVECMALGEARYGALSRADGILANNENFTFVLVDEGIAATHYVSGQLYRGAGNAGRIGRLVVLPDGSYNSTFRSRGPLELYAARPWVSTNIVGEVLAEQGKDNEPFIGDRGFRAAVGAVAQGDWSRLSYKQIAQGVSTNDPAVMTVIEEASRYLGLAIHSIIIVAHPSAVILGGGMIAELPGFGQSVISHARRFTYDVAWNRTRILPATLGREAQVLGAADLAVEMLANPNGIFLRS